MRKVGAVWGHHLEEQVHLHEIDHLINPKDSTLVAQVNLFQNADSIRLTRRRS